MIDYEPYDPLLFDLERAEVVSAKTGEFILGISKLGTATSAWVSYSVDEFSCSEGYNPDENGTLIYESETGTVRRTFWGEPDDLLYPGDRMRASYDGTPFFLGTVATTDLSRAVDAKAARYGTSYRVDFSALLLGTYEVMLAAEVCYASLPAEDPYTRLRRWVTIDG